MIPNVSAFIRTVACCAGMSLPLCATPSAPTTLEVSRLEAPALKGKAVNPILSFTLRSGFPSGDAVLSEVEVALSGPAAIAAVAKLHLGVGKDTAENGAAVIASAESTAGVIRLRPDRPVNVTAETFWLAVTLAEGADPDARVLLDLQSVRVGGRVVEPANGPFRAEQRIGIALRKRGDDGSHSYRIPGLAATNAGTLIAVYDIRREHCRDLPARIDVGVSRSTDGGKTWMPMQIAMTPASLGVQYAAGGIGDPAVLLDRASGRIWVAALWAHGDIGWESSKPGLTPEETGQLLMTYSDDDGKTWAPLRNLTTGLKDPAWRLFFNGPGAGICMSDGTLVFPAMYRSADGGETQGKPFATIIWSRDQGETWHVGSGAKIDTTEAQVVELADGSLMLNCRDNRGATRTVMITRDLGSTWAPHATDRAALEDPVCMASLLRWQHPQHGDLLLFSNPASTVKRNNMTLKVSRDGGMTWPGKWHLLYDGRIGSGYSCLAPADERHVGVLYEGKCEIYFLRVPLAEVLSVR